MKTALLKFLYSFVFCLAVLCSLFLKGISHSNSKLSCLTAERGRLIAIQSCGVFGDVDADGFVQFAFKADLAIQILCPGSLEETSFLTTNGGNGKALHQASITGVTITAYSTDEGSTFNNLTNINLALHGQSAATPLHSAFLENTSLNGLTGEAACVAGKIGIPTNATLGAPGGVGPFRANNVWPNGGDRVELLTTRNGEKRYLMKYTESTDTFTVIPASDYQSIISSGSGIFPAVSLGYNSADNRIKTSSLKGANALKVTITVSEYFLAGSGRNGNDMASEGLVIGSAVGKAW